MMHRFIMECGANQQIDHANGNKLDNRRANLRFATTSQNSANVGKRKDSRNRFKGIHFHRHSGLWQAKIHFNGKRVTIGYFRSDEDAARAYDAKAREVFGEFARTNF